MSKSKVAYLSDTITTACLGLTIAIVILGTARLSKLGYDNFIYLMCSTSIPIAVALFRVSLSRKILTRGTPIKAKITFIRKSVLSHRYVEFRYTYNGEIYEVKRDVIVDEINDDQTLDLILNPQNPKKYLIV